MIFNFNKHKLPLGANPDRTERTIERWISNAKDTEYCRSVASDPRGQRLLQAIAGNSPFLANNLQRDAIFFCQLLQDGPDIIFKEILARVNNTFDPFKDTATVMFDLREAKRHASLTFGIADIAEVWDVDRIMQNLSYFAEATISVATRHALCQAANVGRVPLINPSTPDIGSGYVVLALGKLGAQELNYSSDVDLIILYDPERLPHDNPDMIGANYVRVTRDIVKILEERTADGYVHRTDLRLRPDPGTTPVAISTIAAETYYESVGQNWERMAMIRARAIAGDIELGEEFLHQLRPFIWRKNLDFAAIQDIHSVKRQITAHSGGSTMALNGHNIKLGRGGIREIEFFAQTQQIIWGGRITELRDQKLAATLNALVDHGRIAKTVATDLIHSYRYLRRIEHRLQMVDDKQTHELPKTDEKFEEFAVFAGYANGPTFRDEISENLQRVERHYAALFRDYRDLGAQGSLVFTGNDLHIDTEATLREMGFKDPARIFNTVRIWHHGRYRATRSERSRQLLTELMPQLLSALAKTANADVAFIKMDEFLARLPAGVQVLSLIHSNPILLDLIAMVMGDAPSLADSLSRNPHLLDYVLTDEFYKPVEGAEMLLADLKHALYEADHFEHVLDITRRWTNDHKFRLGVQVLTGIITPISAGPRLASIAETVIKIIIPIVEAKFEVQHGQIAGSAVSAIAYGKLGGRELTHGSDLDIVFVYDHAPEIEASNGAKPLAPGVYFMRLAQRIISAISAPTGEGKLYEVDLRLRPSGNNGPVAVHINGYLDYLKNSAWTWELMALTRARPICGMKHFQDRIRVGIFDILRQKRDRKKLFADIINMRQRVTKEHISQSKWDINHRSGGLVDIEFVTQALQLLHASSTPDVLSTSTAGALANLHQAKFIKDDDVFLFLSSLKLWQSLQSIIRLTGPERLDDGIPPDGQANALCRAAAVESFEQLKKHMEIKAKQTRSMFLKFLTPAN